MHFAQKAQTRHRNPTMHNRNRLNNLRRNPKAKRRTKSINPPKTNSSSISRSQNSRIAIRHKLEVSTIPLPKMSQNASVPLSPTASTPCAKPMAPLFASTLGIVHLLSIKPLAVQRVVNTSRAKPPTSLRDHAIQTNDSTTSSYNSKTLKDSNSTSSSTNIINHGYTSAIRRIKRGSKSSPSVNTHKPIARGDGLFISLWFFHSRCDD